MKNENSIEIVDSVVDEIEKNVPDQEFYDELMALLSKHHFFLLYDKKEEKRLFPVGVSSAKVVAVSTIKALAGAAHFAKVSPLVEDIARVVDVTPEEVRQWAETPLWKAAVKLYGWTGDPTPQEKLLSENDPVPLRESFLINKAFQKEPESRVRFETYDAPTIARVSYVERYYFVLQDGEDKHAGRLQKHDVVLAFPEANMPFVKKGIKRRKRLADLGLRPIVKISERPQIDVSAPLSSIVECVMRNELVVVGEYIWNSQYYMVLRVGGSKDKGGKIIIVYKHALYEFRIIKERRKSKKPFHDTWDYEKK